MVIVFNKLAAIVLIVISNSYVNCEVYPMLSVKLQNAGFHR